MKSTRRNFLKQAALIAAGVGGGSGLSAAGKNSCGLAIGTYGLQSVSLGEAIEIIAATGYRVFEITAFPGTTGAPELFSKEKREGLRKLILEREMRLGGIMANLHPKADKVEHRAQLEELGRLIRFGQDLSPEATPIVQTVLGGKVWEDSRALFRERIADWLRVANDQAGLLSIKPHRNHAMAMPAQANWLIEQLGSPARLGMVFDYSHYAFNDPDLSIETMVNEALPHTNYVAVKDARREGDSVRFMLPGAGSAWDHADVIRALYEGGYRGDFCCEVSAEIWRNQPDYDAVKATQSSFEALASAFARAGVAAR